MSRDNNSGAGILIFLASLVLVAMTAKADERTLKNGNLRLVWTSQCPKYQGSSNSNMCKQKIYVDDSITLDKDIKWQDVEQIAKVSFDWKERLKQKLAKK